MIDGDSYAAAVAHRDGKKIVVDAIREVRPPFSPAMAVSNVIIPLAKQYRIYKIYGDNFAGQFAQEPIRDAGLSYELWPQHKSEVYRDPFLSLLNSNLITLPRHDRAINQICSLERSVKRSGRDEITHPTHGHDDLANCIAGVAAAVMQGAASFSWDWVDDPPPASKEDEAEEKRRAADADAEWRHQKFLTYMASGGLIR